MPNVNGTYIFLITFAILLVPFIIILKKKFVCCDDESQPHSNNNTADGIATSRCPPENPAGEVAIGIYEGEIRVKNSDCSICIAEIKKGERISSLRKWPRMWTLHLKIHPL
ncbi:uncharacterized protein LOC107865910 [Capsicum annuum]|uniref:uncharacterized protein LOC107865910 n=1 Tax=Capsicum annuum TaxID=4072 RepID=UPI001FB0C34B|nr:uncharacterized protein LOC107865910 [Capsicum annuum]